MKIETVSVRNPDALNLILGQSHFIKTVEDLYEALVGAIPGIRFGLAFCEASGPALIRHAGTDDALERLAIDNAQRIASGHSFILFLQDAFPINVMGAVKRVPEVCHVFCATSNPVEVVIAETDAGRGILGVVDGVTPNGVETAEDIAARREFLRTIGYKL